MHVVGVSVAPGTPVFETAIACEVFGNARPELADPWYEMRLCSVGDRPVQIAAGFQLESRYGMEDLAAADTVIVPACTDIHQPPPDLVEAVRTAHARGGRIVSFCSGAFVLAAAGLLDGRRATTHWIYATELARRFPHASVDPTVLYVEDEGVFTSAGTAAGLDLCLELVRRDHGTAVANALARRLVIPPHRDGGQAQYVETSVPKDGDPGFSALLEWAMERLDQPLTLADLAGAAHVSTRTLSRRFHAAVGASPLKWLTTQRVRLAQQLLETTDIPVERIADLSGLGSPANLRHSFHRTVGVSPAAYRRTFRSYRGLDDKRRRADIEAALGATSDIDHDWGDDPAAWVRRQRVDPQRSG